MKIPRLIEIFLVKEADDEDEKSPLTFSPANPFDPPAKAKPTLPTAGSAGVAQKQQNTALTSIPAKKLPPRKAAGKPVSDDDIPTGPSKPPAPLHKPSYPGKFVGQVWRTDGPFVNKPTAWKDRATGDMKYGKVVGRADPREVVWDGSEWVSAPEFYLRMKARGGKKESAPSMKEVFCRKSK